MDENYLSEQKIKLSLNQIKFYQVGNLWREIERSFLKL